MARSRPSKRTANVQAELTAFLLSKRAELVAKLLEEREVHLGQHAGPTVGMLAQVDLALKKMEEGSYGRCEACEEEIAPARLRAHPFAVRCTRCQEIWERDQSRAEAGGTRTRGLPEESA